MEERIREDFCGSMEQILNLKEIDIRTYSPLTLAYIGDGVYELIIRSFVVNQGNTQVNKLHRHVSGIVKAETQSRLAGVLEEFLTEEEMSFYKRGRNAKSYTSAKNASIQDYRRATGFEALVGYLYLTGQHTRLMELMNICLKELGEKTDEI